jgi:hypothetical protein
MSTGATAQSSPLISSASSTCYESLAISAGRLVKIQYDATMLHNRRWPAAGSWQSALCDLIEGVVSVNAECDPTYPELDRKACPTPHPTVPQVGHKCWPNFPIHLSASGSVPLMPGSEQSVAKCLYCSARPTEEPAFRSCGTARARGWHGGGEKILK